MNSLESEVFTYAMFDVKGLASTIEIIRNMADKNLKISYEKIGYEISENFIDMSRTEHEFQGFMRSAMYIYASQERIGEEILKHVSIDETEITLCYDEYFFDLVENALHTLKYFLATKNESMAVFKASRALGFKRDVVVLF